MNYEFIKDVIGSPWQIEPQTLNGLYPVFRGMLKGLQIDKGEEPRNHRSYRINATTRDIDVKSWSTPEPPLEDEDIPEPQKSKAKVINILPVRSVLTKHDQMCGPVGTRTLAARLLEADAEDSVIGHILIVESGGGQVIAVPELTDAMQKCTKPIVAWIDGMAASAAYYIISYSGKIIASRETDYVGCIGTMLTWEGRKAKSLENEDGEISVTIYADGSEEKNAEYEMAINEFNFQPAKDRILNPINVKFKSDVAANRPSVTADLLKGKTYSAVEVIGTLIDSIGSFDTAVDAVLELAHFNNDISTGSEQFIINNKPMAKQFSLVNQTLNVEALEGSEDGVFLNEEQLQSIEERLEANQQLVTERDTAVQLTETANTTIGTLRQEVTDAQAAAAAVIDPFNAIDPTIASAETPEAKVAAIRTLLAAKPGVVPAQALSADPKVEKFDGFTAEELEVTKNL